MRPLYKMHEVSAEGEVSVRPPVSSLKTVVKFSLSMVPEVNIKRCQVN
jgi:hypothetical protein